LNVAKQHQHERCRTESQQSEYVAHAARVGRVHRQANAVGKRHQLIVINNNNNNNKNNDGNNNNNNNKK